METNTVNKNSSSAEVLRTDAKLANHKPVVHSNVSLASFKLSCLVFKHISYTLPKRSHVITPRGNVLMINANA